MLCELVGLSSSIADGKCIIDKTCFMTLKVGKVKEYVVVVCNRRTRREKNKFEIAPP